MVEELQAQVHNRPPHHSGPLLHLHSHHLEENVEHDLGSSQAFHSLHLELSVHANHGARVRGGGDVDFETKLSLLGQREREG